MKKVLLLLLSFIPRPLPVGVDDFDKWADDILVLCGSYADPDSMKYVLASNIMHLGPQKAKVAPQFFIRSLRKAAANQVAAQVFQDIKLKKELEAKAAAEVTPSVKEDDVTDVKT